MRKVLFILGQLSDTDTAWLASHGRPQKFPAGTELIRQGTHIDTIYIVLDGTMSVLIDPGIRLDKVGSGDILGELSLVDSGLTTASVRIDRDATVLAVPKSVLKQKLEEDSAFAARFYRALALFLADRMRNAIRRMGYGPDEAAAPPADIDELDASVLDNLHLAGARFERMLKQLAGG
jgi:CRP/FNR family cyclic AMP-dependent transcriptional regulator